MTVIAQFLATFYEDTFGQIYSRLSPENGLIYPSRWQSIAIRRTFDSDIKAEFVV